MRAWLENPRSDGHVPPHGKGDAVGRSSSPVYNIVYISTTTRRFCGGTRALGKSARPRKPEPKYVCVIGTLADPIFSNL